MFRSAHIVDLLNSPSLNRFPLEYVKRHGIVKDSTRRSFFHVQTVLNVIDKVVHIRLENSYIQCYNLRVTEMFINYNYNFRSRSTTNIRNLTVKMV